MSDQFFQLWVAEMATLAGLTILATFCLKFRVQWAWILGIIVVAGASKALSFYGAQGAFGDWIGGSYNYEGKLISFAFLLVVTLLMFKARLKEVGLTFSQQGPAPRFGLWFAAFLFLATAIFQYFYFPGTKTEPIIDMVYQATMPSLQEELWSRGLLLAMLIVAFTPKHQNNSKPFAIALAAVITCLLFWAGHSFFTDGNWAIEFRPWWNLISLFYAIFWVVVRLATGSLLLPILLHTWANCSGYFI